MGRTTQGVRLIKLKEGESVVAVEKILEPDEEIESMVEATSETASETKE